MSDYFAIDENVQTMNGNPREKNITDRGNWSRGLRFMQLLTTAMDGRLTTVDYFRHERTHKTSYTYYLGFSVVIVSYGKFIEFPNVPRQ